MRDILLGSKVLDVIWKSLYLFNEPNNKILKYTHIFEVLKKADKLEETISLFAIALFKNNIWTGTILAHSKNTGYKYTHNSRYFFWGFQPN